MKISTKYLKFCLFVLISSFPFTDALAQTPNRVDGRTEIRYVASGQLKVFSEPDSSSTMIGTLYHLDKIVVQTIGPEMTSEVRAQIKREKGIWVRIVSPLRGYIFQKRLIMSEKEKEALEKDEEISVSNFLDKILGRKRKPTEESEESIGGSFSGSDTDLWVDFNLGILVFPEDSAYSVSIPDTFEFSVDYNYTPIPFLKIRGGLNMTKSTGGSNETSTNSLYGAIRFPFEIERPSFIPDSIGDPKFAALAGLACMMTSQTSGGSESSSDLGFIVGVIANANFKEGWRLGTELKLLSGSASLGGSSKSVGSTQINATIGKSF